MSEPSQDNISEGGQPSQQMQTEPKIEVDQQQETQNLASAVAFEQQQAKPTEQAAMDGSNEVSSTGEDNKMAVDQPPKATSTTGTAEALETTNDGANKKSVT